MEKLTPQIAALYLGQKCETPVGVAELITVNNDWVDVFTTDNEVVNFLIVGIKPILRPLSSLTESEAREVYEMSFGGSGVEDVDDNDFLFFWNTPARFEIYRMERLYGYPNGWLKLLSWGFDLFGLIESGIAIDATKIETETTV